MAATNGNRIRVMQVTHDLGVGGLPRVVETLSQNLDPDRFDVEVLCLRDGGPLADRLAERDIPSFVLDRPPTRLRADYFAAFRIAKHMRERRPTIVHTHNTEPFVEAGFAAKFARVPILIHTDHARDFPDLKRLMMAESVMSRFSDYVVAVSEHGEENLRRYIKVPERKLLTVLNGVEPATPSDGFDREAHLAQYDITPDSVVIGLGARFSEQKGITYLLQALPTVVERHPNVRVILAGYGPLEEDHRAEAARLGLDPYVRFIGKVNSMSDVLACLDVFALPSIWEGLPMAILESMSVGLPIVATDVGGVRGALSEENAVLVPSADPPAFADGLLRLLDAPGERQRLGERARRDFNEKFGARVMAESYMELYERALERKS